MKKRVWKNIKDLLIIVGTAIAMAFAYKLFIVPNSFAPSGINGVATMIQYKFGFSIGYMSLLVNIPLCIFSYFTTDRRFAIRTALFCVVYSVTYLIIQPMDMENIQYSAHGVDTVFPCMAAGMLSGAIYGVIFKRDASSGGTDIISKYISKKEKTLNIFYVNFFLNALVAAASFFVYAQKGESGLVYDYKPVCLCLLYSFISSYIGNRILEGAKAAYRYTIITDHAREIEEEIIGELHHTATAVQAEGAYTHGAKQVLFCVINPYQMVALKEILLKYDNTFAFVEPVSETIGKFNRITRWGETRFDEEQ